MEKQNLDDFLLEIMQDRKKRKLVLCYCKNNSNLPTELAQTRIAPEVLQKFIPYAYKKRILPILVTVLWSIDAEAITEAVFSEVMRLPRRARFQCYAPLEHMELVYYQLRIINKEWPSEAFIPLFQYILRYECFTIEDMKQFLNESNATQLLLKECIAYSMEEFGMSDKLGAATIFCEQQDSIQSKVNR